MELDTTTQGLDCAVGEHRAGLLRSAGFVFLTDDRLFSRARYAQGRERRGEGERDRYYDTETQRETEEVTKKMRERERVADRQGQGGRESGEGETDRQTDTDRDTTVRQTDRQAGRHTDSHRQRTAIHTTSNSHKRCLIESII